MPWNANNGTMREGNCWCHEFYRLRCCARCWLWFPGPWRSVALAGAIQGASAAGMQVDFPVEDFTEESRHLPPQEVSPVLVRAVLAPLQFRAAWG